MISIGTIIQHLEGIAPPAYQESYDNAGLIVGNKQVICSGVITCLDTTEDVVDEAIKHNCNLIVAHHPIVFRGLKRFNGSNYVERVVMKAIKHDIAIYAIHTNLDNVYAQGVNTKIAERLGLINTRILFPKTGLNDPFIGAGLFGELVEPMSEMAFLEYLKIQMKTPCIKYTALNNKPVQKIALCGGAGGFLLPQAIAAEAHVFITGDYKYHEFFDAENKIIIADIGHFESEQFTIELLAQIIQEKFRTFAVRLTEINTNPVNYL